MAVAVTLGACNAGSADGPSSAAAPATRAPATVAVEAPAAAERAVGTRQLEPVRRFRSVRGHVEVAVPTGLRVPSLGIDRPLETLGRQPDGAVEAPMDWQRPGWFSEGARPGQRGPAVILGHIDSRAGPAVFQRLHELQAGDAVLVDRADTSTVRFVVDRVERHPKDAFPTRAVYFPTLEPVLRLITCGGAFNGAARSYEDNVIVFATLDEH